MAVRVTTAEVKEIIDTDMTDVDPQITLANVIVNSILGDETDLSADQLEKIELLLAAHFVYLYDPQRKSEKLGDAQDQFNLPVLEKGLDASPFGQQAKLLDTTGKLARTGLKRASLKAIDLEL